MMSQGKTERTASFLSNCFLSKGSQPTAEKTNEYGQFQSEKQATEEGDMTQG
jgi:hypothetical protein